MYKFKDVGNVSFFALAEINFRHMVNGEKSISGTVYSNKDVICSIDRGWTIEYENETYYIIQSIPADTEDGIAEFDAIHEFFYKFGKSCVYSELNGSNTMVKYLSFIFDNSGYQYNLQASVSAFEKENFGMKNRLALFNDLINSTGLEFEIAGKIVTIKERLGSDLSTIVRKGFNMQELTIEKNIGDFVTYARGFGAFKDPDDPSKGRLETFYRSPLADVYGVLESDPVVDERYSIQANLEAKLKSLVEASYTISVNLTLEDLQRSGYNYSLPVPGDYILAINENISFQQKIRIIGIEKAIDVSGNVIENRVTCSSLSQAEVKQNADASIKQTWQDIENGLKVIPQEWLTEAVNNATEALLSAQTELKFTQNGILAVDKTNANNVVILNSNGMGISTDGGKTFENAITAAGVNASAIATGVLKAINILGVYIQGSEIVGGTIDGSALISRPTQNLDHTMVIKNSGINFYKPNTNINAVSGDVSIYASPISNYGQLWIKVGNNQLTLTGDSSGTYTSSLRSGLQVGKILEANGGLYARTSFTIPNGAAVNFYSSLNMNGYSIVNQSDIRLKKNIVDTSVQGIIETKKIKMVDFDWRDDYNRSDTEKRPDEQQFGMIAQYSPFLSRQGDDNHYLVVDVNKQINLNTLTNQELIKEVETLQERIVRIERRLDDAKI